MSSEICSRLSRAQHFVLDLDGTVYTGSRLHDPALRLLAGLQSRGLSYSFLTNNTSRARQEYVSKLRGFGIDVEELQIANPVASVVQTLRGLNPDIHDLFVLGTPALHGEFEAAGFRVGLTAESEPDAVVVGFDTSLSYERLCLAGWWIDRGLPYLATHPDLVCPTDDPTISLDCGSICAALHAATGRSPDAVFGKPDPAMLTEIAGQQSIGVSDLVVVGDRLMTDMAMANRAGALAVLVLTGEASVEDVAALGPEDEGRPDLVVADLDELLQMISSAS